MKIYIVLSNTGSFPSKIINKALKSEYTHVSISIDNNLTHMYSFGRKYLYFPWYGGFIKENIKLGMYKRMKFSKIAVYEVNINKKNYKKIVEELHKFEENEDVYFYDFLGAIGIYFKKDLFRTNGYICSSFVNEILSKTDLNTNFNHNKILPMHFKDIKFAKLIYEGFAFNYMKGSVQ